LLVRALGFSDVTNQAAIAQAKMYASSVLTTIEGDSKLQDLEPRSVVLAMIDAAKFKLEIDGRKLAYIVPYGGKATMQVSYKGMLAKLKDFYPDMSFTVEVVYEGDVFEVSDNSGFQTYTHKKLNPFETDIKKVMGVFVSLAWTDNEVKQQKITIVSKADLVKMQGKSKSGTWNEWYAQMAIKSAIKRACKIHFAAISSISEIIEYDNKINYNLTTDALDEGKPNIIDNLNANIIEQPKTENEGEK
jgi:phage RecT family recombinase